MIRWIKRLFYLAALALFGVYLAVGAFLWVLQDRMIFPAPGGIGRDSLDAAAYEIGARPMDLTASDGARVYAWYLRTGRRTAGRERAVLYLHGNGERVSDYSPLYRLLVQHGFDVLAIAYRGYPGSEERPPSEEGLAIDARAAWDWLAERYPHDRIVVHGRSLGGGVGARLVASDANPRALVLESTFSSVLQIAQRTAPVYPVSLMLQNHFDTRQLAPHLGVPVFIMHSRDDTLIPLALSAKALRPMIAEVEYEETSGLTHQDALPLSDPLLRSRYLAFLERMVPLDLPTGGALPVSGR